MRGDVFDAPQSGGVAGDWGFVVHHCAFLTSATIAEAIKRRGWGKWPEFVAWAPRRWVWENHGRGGSCHGDGGHRIMLRSLARSSSSSFGFLLLAISSPRAMRRPWPDLRRTVKTRTMAMMGASIKRNHWMILPLAKWPFTTSSSKV